MHAPNPSTVFPMQEAWDTLVILDACRFDYFERVYTDYFSGKLNRRTSLGTWTYDWARRAFPDVYPDVIYISSNPMISSGYVPRSSLPWVKGVFMGNKHFFRTLDVWHDGWDSQFGTVFPQRVNEAALKAIHAYPEKRLIVHYYQPHTPYISLGGIQFRQQHKWKYKAAEILPWFFIRLFGGKKGLHLLNRLGMSRASLHKLIVDRLGPNALKTAYEDDLRLVLGCVAELLDYLKGRIIVTSDHGEFLGEGGQYGHSGHDVAVPQEDPVTQIPWMEIHREEIRKKPPASLCETLSTQDEISEELIRERLKTLGYL